MSPEALARLRMVADTEPELSNGESYVRREDLRALLDAYDEAVAERDELRLSVEASMLERDGLCASIEAVVAERDTARAEGVAAERARVVAWLRAADSETLVWFAAQRIEQGWHDKEGER